MTTHSRDHLTNVLPRVTLSAARDQRIRAMIASAAPSSAEPDMQRFAFRFPRFAVALAAFVAIVGVSGYTYASPSVTRGDTLYPAKRAMERARGSFAGTPLARVRYHSDLALRRVGELDVLVREQNAPTGTALIPTAYAQEGDPATASESATTDATADTTVTEGEPTTDSGTPPDLTTEDPIITTTAEVAGEVEAAAAAAEDITEPAVADAALDVLAENHGAITDALVSTANSAGVADTDVTEAIAVALETVDAVATATDAAATEVAAAADAGEETVTVELVAASADDADEEEDVDEDADGADANADAIAEVQAALTEARAKLATLQIELTEAGVPANAIARLTARISTKLDAVESALDGGHTRQAQGLLKAAKALRNNAKHFFRQTEQRAARAVVATEALVDAQVAVTAAATAIGEDAPKAAQRLLAQAQKKIVAAQAAANAEEFMKARALAKVAGRLAERSGDTAERAAAQEARAAERTEERAERAADRADDRADRAEERTERAEERRDDAAERAVEVRARAEVRRTEAVDVRIDAAARRDAAAEERGERRPEAPLVPLDRAREALDAVTDRVEDRGEQGRDAARDALDRADDTERGGGGRSR